MTPTDCLKAGPAELAPIVEQLMPTWRAHFSPGGKPFFAYLTSWGLDGYFDPFEIIEHAFRIQSRVSELGLQLRFALWLGEVQMSCNEPLSERDSKWIRGLDLSDPETQELADRYLDATASPLNRTRAACAAWISSKETA